MDARTLNVEGDPVKETKMRRNACVVVVALLFGLLQAHAAKPVWSEARLQQLHASMAPAREAARAENLQGRPAQALEHLRASIDHDDWLALLALANSTWTMYPAESFAWHQRAYDLSEGDHSALFELALHYTRHGQCDRSVEAWETLDKAGLLHSHMPMLAGYCYLQLGEDARAFAMFDRAQVRHGRFEKLLEALWGRPHVLVEHAQRLAAFNADGDPADLDAALANAIRFDADGDRGQALLAITDAAVRRQHATLATPLACLRPTFELEASRLGISASQSESRRNVAEFLASLETRKTTPDAWRAQLAACRMLIEGHPLPENSVLMKFLVTRALNMQIASPEELLGAHGAILMQRARSGQRDLGALEVLAALQERASDPALADTDMLGWDTYGLPAFAMSRVASEIKAGTLSATGKVLLARAYAQFPHDARILHAWLQHGNPDENAAREGWRELAFVQFHAPSMEMDDLHLQPVPRTLYVALQAYRDAVGLAGRQD